MPISGGIVCPSFVHVMVRGSSPLLTVHDTTILSPCFFDGKLKGSIPGGSTNKMI
jgi:hypothetical protein